MARNLPLAYISCDFFVVVVFGHGVVVGSANKYQLYTWFKEVNM